MIDEIVKSLPKGDRDRLLIAFQQEISQYIELEGDMFIGVNVGSIPKLEILESSGVWAYGRIKT